MLFMPERKRYKQLFRFLRRFGLGLARAGCCPGCNGPVFLMRRDKIFRRQSLSWGSLRTPRETLASELFIPTRWKHRADVARGSGFGPGPGQTLLETLRVFQVVFCLNISFWMTAEKSKMRPLPLCCFSCKHNFARPNSLRIENNRSYEPNGSRTP